MALPRLYREGERALLRRQWTARGIDRRVVLRCGCAYHLFCDRRKYEHLYCEEHGWRAVVSSDPPMKEERNVM